MPTFRQLVTSNPGSAWMRGHNQQQQLTAARNQFPTTAGQVGYGGSMSSPLANQTANASRAYALGMPNATSYMPSYQQLAAPTSGDAQALRDRQSAIRAYMEMTPGLNQGLPEFAAQRSQLMSQRDDIARQLQDMQASQARPQGSRQVYDAKQSNARFFRDRAANSGGSWQSTPQDYLRRADQQQRERFGQGGPSAQWGWDQGSATWQPGNQMARDATFGALAGPSASYQAAQTAQQQAYAIPAQQQARTRQMIYGYGGR